MESSLVSEIKGVHAVTASCAENGRTSQQLGRVPVGWSMEFAPDFLGETGYKWTPDCTQDTLQPMEEQPYRDVLDYQLGIQSGRQGAEWAYRNACRKFDG